MKLTEEERLLITRRAKELGSDGCTGTVEIFRICCLQHDIAYRTRHDMYGDPITRREADAQFRRCMQGESRLGRFSIIAVCRWILMRIVGRGAW